MFIKTILATAILATLSLSQAFAQSTVFSCDQLKLVAAEGGAEDFPGARAQLNEEAGVYYVAFYDTEGTQAPFINEVAKKKNLSKKDVKDYAQFAYVLDTTINIRAITAGTVYVSPKKELEVGLIALKDAEGKIVAKVFSLGNGVGVCK
ncbi:hypothetical protein SHI21_17635 [Bacteriovorax sp. PP10]|uniref:Uncharacterized protein n=1 Tax=Bacteriovorax antarcticus TaxID=3088717 RepID=A0ABU5VYA6_9BACT|nr:hypothetical protein [Bacteriovorax sp. PP10]MEA9358059.1 hypothetical protein [Bacteriovorax sp. PP10]